MDQRVLHTTYTKHHQYTGFSGKHHVMAMHDHANRQCNTKHTDTEQDLNLTLVKPTKCVLCWFQCKHKMGYGFRRGGYICHCAPGRRYPWSIDLPYQGDNIEQATEEEYRNGFTCTPVNCKNFKYF